MVVHQGFNDIANRSLKFLLAVWAYEPCFLVVACRYFTGRAIVLITPHGSGHRELGSQIIDTRNNLATCANRATCAAILYGMNYIADRSFKLLLTIGAYEPRFLVAAYRYFAGGGYVFLALHIAEILGHLVAKSLTPEMTFLELIVLVFMVDSLSPRIFEACDKKMSDL